MEFCKKLKSNKTQISNLKKKNYFKNKHGIQNTYKMQPSAKGLKKVVSCGAQIIFQTARENYKLL